MHGVLAIGIYGSVVNGPSLNFSPGNYGIDVSITSPAELGWTSAQSAAEKSIAPLTPTRLILPQPKAEVSLSTTKAKRESSSRVAAPQSAPSQGQSISAVSMTSPCTTPECPSHASLGKAGDIGAFGAGVVHAPKPPYPWEARRAGFEGSLVVNVDIDKEGLVRNAELSQSSGREDCDRAALDTIRERWRFEPARLLGRPIEWREKVVVVFSLHQ